MRMKIALLLALLGIRLAQSAEQEENVIQEDLQQAIEEYTENFMTTTDTSTITDSTSLPAISSEEIRSLSKETMESISAETVFETSLLSSEVQDVPSTSLTQAKPDIQHSHDPILSSSATSESVQSTSIAVSTHVVHFTLTHNQTTVFQSTSSELTKPAEQTTKLTDQSSTTEPSVEPSGIEDVIMNLNESMLDRARSENADKAHESEEEEPDSRFMSFEEWKKQKIESGQASSDAKKRDARQDAAERPQLKQQINQNIHGIIGEEMEIDFGMFGGSSSADEGGKVYKDRFNYASFDCAATIVKSNSEAKGASSILNENKDSYLLNECKAPNKFVTIELCQDILVDTVLLGNYEFFSSTFKKIRLSVSDRFPIPVNQWKVLGDFEAENVRALQTFHVKNPLIWARYLRLEVLEHYGNEYYCPISVIRVHGQTMMDEFKNKEEEEFDIISELKTISENQVVDINDSSISPNQNSSSNTQSTAPTSASSEDKKNNDTISEKNKTSAQYQSAIVDHDQINTLNEECSVVLPHLALEQFLEGIISTDPDFCREEDGQSLAASTPVETTAKEPTTQESIYKTIMKRLSLLESNASLSLLYIEEQSRLLSTAFTKLEKRQVTKFDLLVSAFNTSIHQQIGAMRDIYANLQDETKQLLKTQRFLHKETLYDTNRQLGSISSELVFFRRLAMFNTVFIICLLAYVIATRDTYIETEFIEEGNEGEYADNGIVTGYNGIGDNESLKSINSGQATGTTTPSGHIHNSGSTSPVSPASSLLNWKARIKKKKKIQFSLSHKLGLNGSTSPVTSGTMYLPDPHPVATSTAATTSTSAKPSIPQEDDQPGYEKHNNNSNSSSSTSSSGHDDKIFTTTKQDSAYQYEYEDEEENEEDEDEYEDEKSVELNNTTTTS